MGGRINPGLGSVLQPDGRDLDIGWRDINWIEGYPLDRGTSNVFRQFLLLSTPVFIQCNNGVHVDVLF